MMSGKRIDPADDKLEQRRCLEIKGFSLRAC